MNEELALPYRLAKGSHRVVASATRDNPLDDFKAAVDRNYVHVKFTETRGGTELGFALDNEHSDLSKADWSAGSGEIRVAGTLNLDGVDVRCEADIDLATLEGTGHLVVIEEAAAEAEAN